MLRAVEVTDKLPPPLRNAQLHAILSVLSDKLRARLEQKMINPDKIHEKPATRRFRLLLEKQGREEGRKEGRAASLLLVLGHRGLGVTDAQRARIEGCSDVAQLDAWLAQALTAASVDEILAAHGKPGARKSTARASGDRSRAARTRR